MKAKQKTFFVNKISEDEFIMEDWPDTVLSKEEYRKLVNLLEIENGPVIKIILFVDYSHSR